MSKIAAASAEGTPPEDFEDFVSVVVGRLLGYEPPNYDPEDPERLQIIARFRADYHHSHWPRDLAGLEYLHRALARRLWERGGTPEAADGIRHDLEAGRIRAVVIDDDDGEDYQIPPQRWRAADGSRYLYHNGRADVTVPGGRRFSGDIYLISAAEPEPAPDPVKADPERSQPDWWPTPAQSMVSWAKDQGVVREAERRVKAAGVRLTEAAKDRAMEAMASEADRPWAAASIGPTRRRAG
jgi:hypothetical protein